MSEFSLYSRFRTQGTLSEVDGVPNPIFALPATVHWIRAYAIIIADENINFTKSSTFYSAVNKVAMSETRENSIFEHLLLAIHQLASLKAMALVKPQADVVRVASVAWYYGIYASITAMVAAQDGIIQDNHTGTANTWGRQFAANKNIPYPFNLRISTLVEKEADQEINTIRGTLEKGNLIIEPKTVAEAHRAICSYISGTREWREWSIKEEIKKSPEFINLRDTKGLPVKDFKTGAAKQLRDARLKKHSISFAHQAIRFRGKANYREALYLAHGKSVEKTIDGFILDMSNVLEAFTAIAGAFCFARLGSDLRDGFLQDLDKHRSFSLDPKEVWSA